MKVYINIKRNSNLRLHQPFNKRIGLMKRERTHRTLHHFSFGERFDENNDECISLWLSVHYPINSSIHRIFIHQQVCRTNGRKEMPLSADRSDSRQVGCPTDRQGKAYHIDDKKRSAYTASTLTGFWKQKSHSLLGHFLYAVQAQLKMPQ